MTAQEVSYFINHLYGEQSYIVENDDLIIILSLKSKWVIFKKDFSRGHVYTLFHFNDTERQHFHVQMKSNNLDYLVFRAIMHDNPFEVDWKNFKNQWDSYCYGREMEELENEWRWLSGEELE